MEIGEKLKWYREQKNMSVYRLSKLADISENYIHALEKSKSNPSIFVLQTLLEHLGITMAEFFNDSEEIIYASEIERQHINDLRSLDEERTNAIVNITRLLSSRN